MQCRKLGKNNFNDEVGIYLFTRFQKSHIFVASYKGNTSTALSLSLSPEQASF